MAINVNAHIYICKTALGKITFVTRFLPSENKVYTYIHSSVVTRAAAANSEKIMSPGHARWRHLRSRRAIYRAHPLTELS